MPPDSTSSYRLPPHLRREVYDHARRHWPHETCGFILDGEFIPVLNTHPYPALAFRIDARLLAEAQATGKLEAIVHSHTHGQRSPSKADMIGQARTKVPWVVAVLDERGAAFETFVFPQALGAPVKSGVYHRFGVDDCWLVVRRVIYQTYNHVLPDIAREDGFWSSGENLFVDRFEDAAFRWLGPEEKPQKYDVGLLSVGAGGRGIANHCFVYLGGNLILHHLPTRLAAEEPAGPWLRRAQRWGRFDPEKAARLDGAAPLLPKTTSRDERDPSSRRAWEPVPA